MNIQLGDIQLKKAYTKPLYRALSEIFGIGSANASSFCKELGLSKSERLGSLSKYKQQVVLQMFSDYLTDNNIMIDNKNTNINHISYYLSFRPGPSYFYKFDAVLWSRTTHTHKNNPLS